MIIDTTYFEVLEARIPGKTDINAQPVGAPTVTAELDATIDKYERDLLLNALGVTLYNELVAEFAKKPFDPEHAETAAQKWQDLILGKDYTIDDKVKRWDGLQGYSKQSLIAFFVACQYQRNDELTYTIIGVIRSTSDTADSADALTKYVRNWGEFMDKYQGNLHDLTDNRFIEASDSFTREDDIRVSLYQYLVDQNELDATAFPDFEFKVYQPYNRFGF